jgi:hypothetical protein
MAEQNLNIRVSLSGMQSVTNGLRDMQLRISAFSRSLTGTALGLAGVGGLGAALYATIRTGVNFNATLEQARLGIAAVQSAVNPGAFRSFDHAMKVSGGLIDDMKVKARTSKATFEELVESFQALTGPATAAGVPLERQTELITELANAVRGVGLPSFQIMQEARSMLTGNITSDSFLARAIGITSKDLENAQQAGKVYEYLMEKIRAFAEAAKRGENSFDTLASNIKDAFTQAAAAATVPIFEKFKSGMAEMLKADWEQVGQTIGDWISAGMRSWEGGSFDRFIAVNLAAAFEEGVDRLKDILTAFFGLDQGLWVLIQRLLVRMGYGIRSEFLGALKWLASFSTDSAVAKVEGYIKANDASKAEAFAAMGMDPSVGRSNRDELSRMIAEQRGRREARDRSEREVIDLPNQTVQGKKPTEPAKLDPTSFGDTFRLTLAQLQVDWGTWALQTANVFKTVFESSIQSISDGISGLILRTKTWGQALREIGVSILTTVVQSIVEMGVRWVLTRIMMATIGKAIGAAEMAATIGMNSSLAASLSAIWATPAALATTATYGSAAAAAPGIISASIAATKGISLVSQVGGMATGGLTPGRPTLTFVGEEGPEYVINADATRRNRGVLEAINSGAVIRPVSGGDSGSGDPRPVNVNLYFDRQAWVDASRDDIESIAIDALRRERR